MQKLIIYGNGRIAKIIYQFVKKQFDVVAFTVDRDLIAEVEVELLPLIPFDEIQDIYSPQEHKMLIAVGYVQMNVIRAQKYTEAKEKGYEFSNYIHPSVDMHENIVIGDNNIILEHVSIQPYVKLGNSNFIWSNVVVAHGSRLGNTNWLTSGVVISGDVTIKSNCFLGVNATIGHNITLENENFIGANTLITKSTKEKEVFVSRDGEKFRLDSQRFMEFSGV
ncbi:MAG: acetyltransferase [gamma proteobacterium symbiont of Taylorina sp.]|nr:acetyltransferase [gamma proteobacterium symbiont of Taylorina sp.]